MQNYSIDRDDWKSFNQLLYFEYLISLSTKYKYILKLMNSMIIWNLIGCFCLTLFCLRKRPDKAACRARGIGV